MSKMIRLTLVSALAATVSACDVSEEDKPAQRDVYTSLEDCVADWGDTELCERQQKEAREHELKMAEANKASGGSSDVGVSFIPLFFGPTYHGNDRFYRDSRGEIYQPSTQRARQSVGWNPSTRSLTNLNRTATPVFKGNPSSVLASRSSAASRTFSTTSSSSSSAGRGGFGATGASSSSAG